ncbi:MAG: hypothetical protein HKN62_01630 [Phycisphaerales bacterium]|nr:hypothetical protein [Phycisphaerales bacterium]
MHRAAPIAAFLAISSSLTAQDCIPPPNETCDGAIVFTLDDLPYDFKGPLGCENDIADKPYFDVFFRYDCTCTGEYTVDMCDSSGDTYLRIYTGACGWSGGSEFAVADDECPGSPPNADPRITVTLEAGTTYWFELGTWRPDPPWAPPPNSPYNFRVTLCSGFCPADLDGSGDVGFADLLTILAAWGPCPGCPADLDGSGDVGFTDLLSALAAWGACGP